MVGLENSTQICLNVEFTKKDSKLRARNFGMFS